MILNKHAVTELYSYLTKESNVKEGSVWIDKLKSKQLYDKKSVFDDFLLRKEKKVTVILLLILVLYFFSVPYCDKSVVLFIQNVSPFLIGSNPISGELHARLRENGWKKQLKAITHPFEKHIC